jgi:hypothetical protein
LEEPEEYIDFMAKYGDWISIRRLGIRPGTKPEEVVHHMAGIRSVIDGKSYSLLGIKTGVLDECAGKITSGQRKSYESLGRAIESLGGSESKAALESSCENKELVPIAGAYLLGKVITSLGFDSGINQSTMAKIFHDLKMPKAPGIGRKKKAEA